MASSFGATRDRELLGKTHGGLVGQSTLEAPSTEELEAPRRTKSPLDSAAVYGEEGLARQLLRSFLEESASFESVLELTRPEDVRRSLSSTVLDLLVVSAVDMGEDQVVDLLEVVDGCRSRVATLVVGSDYDLVRRGCEPLGVLPPDTDVDSVIAAIHMVTAGFNLQQAPFIGEYASRVDRRIRNRIEQQLTEREVSILKLIARGDRNSEIADLLGRSPSTIKAQIQSILVKLDAHNRADAAAMAAKSGLLSASSILS